MLQPVRLARVCQSVWASRSQANIWINYPIISGYYWAIVRLPKVQSWEAFDHASYYKLDNLVAILDVNRLGQRGETMHGWNTTLYAERAAAFGWNAIVIDGHNYDRNQSGICQGITARW